ncbi:glycan-binding surface protein [Mangrovibacterium lignilyticum]|uniref:glycan-binding surface protein n=1 Tax=Mangrovibacterium lignilyticum TaxID=2668052 RepID=UPI0013D833A6|nr:glycan-binding surface protein [Mangrovibacterium lignilyticum]
MKTKFRYIYLALVVITLGTIYSACNDEDTSGVPRIDYVRITAPESADSLIVSAGQGQLIAIMGENLGGTVRIEFNNIAAEITTPYITNSSVLVRVPAEVPEEVNNQLVLYFDDGTSLAHDFTVAINKPSVTSMDCEYVNDGGVAVIHGNYFYEPLTVIFPGDLEGEVVSVEDETIKVMVPEGTSPGQLAVRSNFGTGLSSFKFRDDRNIVLNSDPFVGWAGSNYVVSNPGTGDPELINGNYIRVKQQIGAWGWTDVAAGSPSDMGALSKNIPDDAILHPELYSLKFEVNTLKPFNGSGVRLVLGLTGYDPGSYTWNPPYDSEGNWATVTISFKEMVDAYVAAGSEMIVTIDGYYTRLTIFGGTALDCDMCFDNFRIVPNKY